MSTVLNVLVRLERVLIIFFCLALAGLMVFQIIMRYVFVAPFLGFEEVTVLLGLWIYFLGLVHITRTREHISSGVVQLFLQSQMAHKALEIFKLALCTLSSGVFLYFSVLYWLKTAESGRSSTYLSWPTTVWISSMVFGFAIATLLFVAQLWRAIANPEPPNAHDATAGDQPA